MQWSQLNVKDTAHIAHFYNSQSYHLLGCKIDKRQNSYKIPTHLQFLVTVFAMAIFGIINTIRNSAG